MGENVTIEVIFSSSFSTGSGGKEATAGDLCWTTAAPGEYYWLPYLVLGLVSMGGNGLVVLLYFLKRVDHNATNLIITNLALVDFLSGFSLIFIKSLPRIPKPVGSGVVAQIYCRLYCSEYPLWALLNASAFNLTLVAADRYLSVIAPFFHKIKFSRPLILHSCIIVTWI